MLYVINRRNADLQYREGQERIVHLVSTVNDAIAAAQGRPWAFSDGNAGARYTQFCADLGQLNSFVDWRAVEATDWRDPAVKEHKQAEFLVHDSFPWTSIRGIGVYSPAVRKAVLRVLEQTDHRPAVNVKRSWYY